MFVCLCVCVFVCFCISVFLGLCSRLCLCVCVVCFCISVFLGFWVCVLDCACVCVCLCSRLCGYHSPLHLLISWCVVVIHSKGDLFATSSDWECSIVTTYWQVKHKKRECKRVKCLLQTFLWDEKKVASNLCRRGIILRE